MAKRFPGLVTGLALVIGWAGALSWSQPASDGTELDPTAFIAPEGLEGTGEAVPEGAKPVLRGPVHEAYAQPARVKPQPGPIVPKEPPKPIEEIPPDQKPTGNNVQWIPGYWFWDEEKQEYLWVSGIWRALPPGMEWVPGTWIRVEGGWQWVPGYWKPVEQKEVEIVPEPPEPPPLAEPPPAPGPDYFYVPGTWVYVDYRWYWRPGIWVLHRPGWVWTPACYYWTPCGYVFIDGFWDYPFRYRGWLFCPIWVDFAVCYRPGWYWRPCYWVPEPCLTSFLFVHTRRFTFFFGDFYDPLCVRSGFVSIYYYRVHRHCYDPLVSYYALSLRDQDPHWLARQRALTQARIQGTAPRPPRTLEEQRKLLAAAVGDPERQAKIRQLAVAGSVSRVNPKTVPTQKLDAQQLALLRKSAEETRRIQQQRAELEGKLSRAKPEPGKPPTRIPVAAAPSPASRKPDKTPPPPVSPKSQLKPPAAKPIEEKVKPPTSKPGETKPTPTKPAEGKTEPTPTKPPEGKTKPAPSKPESGKPKTPPTPKPIGPPGKPATEEKSSPSPSKLPPLDQQPRPPGLSPSKPMLEDRSRPSPSRPTEEKIRPPSQDKSRPTPTRPGEREPGAGASGAPRDGIRPPSRPTERPQVPVPTPEERPGRPGLPLQPPRVNPTLPVERPRVPERPTLPVREAPRVVPPLDRSRPPERSSPPARPAERPAGGGSRGGFSLNPANRTTQGACA